MKSNSCIHSLNSLIHWLTHSLTHSFTHSLTFTHPPHQSFIRSLIHSLNTLTRSMYLWLYDRLSAVRRNYYARNHHPTAVLPNPNVCRPRKTLICFFFTFYPNCSTILKGSLRIWLAFFVSTCLVLSCLVSFFCRSDSWRRPGRTFCRRSTTTGWRCSRAIPQPSRWTTSGKQECAVEQHSRVFTENATACTKSLSSC